MTKKPCTPVTMSSYVACNQVVIISLAGIMISEQKATRKFFLLTANEQSAMTESEIFPEDDDLVELMTLTRKTACRKIKTTLTTSWLKGQ